MAPGASIPPDATAVDERAARRRTRWSAWGLVAAGVCCLALAAGTAFRLPAFFGADETSHFAYVLYVIEGDLPEVGDPVPSADDRFPVMAERVGFESPPLRHKRGWVHVANHPPLFYVVAAGPVRLSAYGTSDTQPFLMVRLVNAACMAIGVVLAGKLAGELFPRWRGTPLVAAGFTAVTPAVVGVGALSHNDGLAFALTAGALLVMVRLLRRGPRTGLVIAAALLGAACALTRAGLAVAVAGLVLATLIGVLRHSPVPLVRLWSWLRAWSWVIVAVVPAAAATWFYLRNQDLYGSLTADGYLLDYFDRNRQGTRWDVFTWSYFHDEMWRGLYGSVHPRLVSPYSGWVLAVLVALGVAGLGAALVRGIVERSRARAKHFPASVGGSNGSSPATAPPDGGTGELPLGRERRQPAGIGVAGWVLLVAYTAGIVLGVADFVSKGGSPHPRYFLPFVPLVSALLAGAIGALPLRRVIGGAALVGLLAITTSQLMRYDDLIDAREARDALWTTDPAAGPGAQRFTVFVAAVAFAAVLTIIARTPGGDVELTSPPTRSSPRRERSAVPALDAAG